MLDASVALSWCFEDEGGEYAVQVLDALRTDSATVTKFTCLLLSLPLTVDPAERGRAFGETRRLARAHGLTSYDAAYLELGVRLGVPLATLDVALAAAGETEGVPRFGSPG